MSQRNKLSHLAAGAFCAAMFATMFTVEAKADAKPPAQGPPAATQNAENLPADAVTGELQARIDAKLAAENAVLAVNPSHRAFITATVQRHTPNMSTTAHTNQPNQFYADIPFTVTYHISKILYNFKGVWLPYFDRDVTQDIDIETTCEGFATGSGLLTFTPVGAPASLVGDQTFAEDVLSALLLDVIPTFVNDQIRDSLKDFAVDSTPTVSSFACRSLGVSTKAQGFPIESVNFDPPTFRLPGGTSIQEVVVRVTKIHRLQVRAADGTPDGTPVYHVVEVPHLDFYAGYSHIVVPVKGMKEGDTVNLTTGNSVSTPLPPSTGLLVLIANLSSGNDDVNADYAFTTFGSATNFGNGVHTLAVPKHWTQPNAQPSLHQVTLSAPGYQLTLEITVPPSQTTPAAAAH